MSTESHSSTTQDAEFDDETSIRDRLDAVECSSEIAALMDALVEAVDEARAEARTAQQMASDAQSRLLDLREEKSYLEDEIETLRKENTQLEQRIKELQDRTDLMNDVAQGSAMKIEKRAAVCIQTLYNEAWKRKHDGSDDAATASMDYNKADGALGGTLSRSSILRTFKKADELVDGDVVEFISESRSSKRNSRLVLDLRDNEAPRSIAGQELTEPKEVN